MALELQVRGGNSIAVTYFIDNRNKTSPEACEKVECAGTFGMGLANSLDVIWPITPPFPSLSSLNSVWPLVHSARAAVCVSAGKTVHFMLLVVLVSQ